MVDLATLERVQAARDDLRAAWMTLDREIGLKGVDHHVAHNVAGRLSRIVNLLSDVIEQSSAPCEGCDSQGCSGG